MTGTPMPSDAMSRMQMAPEVYKFTKDFAKKPNILEKTGNLIKSAARNTLVGAGLLASMDLQNQQRQQQELMRNEADKAESEAATTSDPVQASEKMQIEKEKTRREEIKIQGKKDIARMANTGVQQTNLNPVAMDDYQSLLNPTTADSYGQDYVPNQTASNVVDRKISQGSQIADSTPNVAEVLSESQDSVPSGFTDPEQVESQMQTDMIGGSGKDQLAKFLSQKGLDQALLGAVGERMTPEPRIDDNSPLIDHPDIVGGEDDINLPGGMNTGATTNLEDHYREMRRMDAMERNKEAINEIVEKTPTPSEMQVGKSPNELAGKDQATFEALMHRNAQLSPDAEGARSRIEQKTAAQQRKLGIKSRLTDQFYPYDVPRTDIQVGGMVDKKTGLGKSVGISYTPMNGDTKVGFNIMSDPTKPTEVSTFDFIAPPETMESIKSRGEDDLGTKSFGKLFNIARARKQGFTGLEM